MIEKKSNSLCLSFSPIILQAHQYLEPTANIPQVSNSNMRALLTKHLLHPHCTHLLHPHFNIPLPWSYIKTVFLSSCAEFCCLQ